MSFLFPRRCFQAARVALGFSLLAAPWGAAQAAAPPQEKPAHSITEEVARTGVFFRADTPRYLRNAQDPDLPVFLEVINGVEKEGLSKVAELARQITRQPVELEGVEVFAKPAGASRQFASDPLLLGDSKEFTFDPRKDGEPFAIPDRLKKTLEIPLPALHAYLDRHFFGGPYEVVDLHVAFIAKGWPNQDTYLRVRLSAPPLPRIPHWYRGDPHYHSGFTDNPAERGYPLDVTKQAALQAGLDWVLLSDHSTDLDAQRYAEEEREAKEYSDGRFLYIVGEEVTVSSNKSGSMETLHMLALPSPDDPDKGFPDSNPADGTVMMTGDGSVGSPGMALSAALKRIVAAGGFAYAAHPDDPISPLLRGGTWDLNADYLAPGGKSLAPGLVGLEPWNRATNLTADNAHDPFCERLDAPPASCFRPDSEENQYTRLEKAFKESWLPLLQKGLEVHNPTGDAPGFKTFIAAGSDAHGDLDYEATMDVTDFIHRSLSRLAGYAEDNAMGKIATVVDCPTGMGPRGENVLKALREGRSVLTNGPLLVAGFDLNGNGSLDDPGDAALGQAVTLRAAQLQLLRLEWASSEEFGAFTSIRMIVGSSQGESAPVEVDVPAGKALASDGLFPLDWHQDWLKTDGEWHYIRLEARTRNREGKEFRCYTNPIWIRVGGMQPPRALE
jgi:hypothetical protein